MGKNLVRKVFNGDGTWVCPAGVTSVRVSAGLRGFPHIAGNTNEVAVALNLDGAAYTWGANTGGVQGRGNGDPVTGQGSSPQAVIGGIYFRQVTAGDSIIGIDLTGLAYAWGGNTHGQLGTGDVTPRSSPVAVIGGFTFRQVSGGQTSTLALRSNGDAYAWGRNEHGQLGLGDVTPRSSPVAVLGGLKFTTVLMGSGSASYGLTQDGSLYAWGNNQSGQLGLGDVTPRSSPVAVLGGLKFRTIAANGATVLGSAYGVTHNGTLYAWGANDFGQLGDGTVTPRSSPVAVLGGLKFRTVNANGRSIIGLSTVGTAYAWGRNTNGQLGVGDVAARSSPVAVLGGLSFVEVAMGGTTSYATATTGFSYGWGYNFSGQAGFGGSGNAASSPILIVGGIKFQAIRETQLNSVAMDVTPGQSYPVSVFAAVVAFGGQGVYQSPYSNAAMPTKITLEYEG